MTTTTTSYSLPGSLDISLNSLNIITDIPHDLSFNIQAKVATVDREIQRLSLADYTYYVQVSYDINSRIKLYGNNEKYDASGNPLDASGNIKIEEDASGNIIVQEKDACGNDIDDAWGLKSLTLTNKTVDASNQMLVKFPESSGNEFEAGVIDLYDVSGVSNLGSFKVILNMTFGASGDLTSKADISGVSIEAKVDDDHNLAQFLYFGQMPDLVVDESTADVLTKIVTADDIKELNQDQLKLLEELAGKYKTNLVKEWTIAINEIPASINNRLSKHARLNGIKDNKVFRDGEKIVASVPASYQISVKELDPSNNTNIFPDNQLVYGVVVQKTGVTTGLLPSPIILAAAKKAAEDAATAAEDAATAATTAATARTAVELHGAGWYQSPLLGRADASRLRHD